MTFLILGTSIVFTINFIFGVDVRDMIKNIIDCRNPFAKR
jgi:hypothetical protein